jgi:hypothetical protein
MGRPSMHMLDIVAGACTLIRSINTGDRDSQ